MSQDSDFQPPEEAPGGIPPPKRLKPKAKPKVSRTALKLDRWSLRRGEEFLHESQPLRQLYEIGPTTPPAAFADIADEVSDFHAACFEPNHEFAEQPKNKRLAEHLQSLIETDEFQVLHQDTQYDEYESETAAFNLAKAWKALEETLMEDEEDPKLTEQEKERLKVGAIFKGLREAQKEIEEGEQVASALGIGSGGAQMTPLERNRLKEAYARVRNNKLLRAICERAGAYRHYAQSQQRRKTLRGRDEVVGITLGNKIPLLLTSEKGRLMDEDFELDTMRRIVEGQAMIRQLSGTEPVAKGPICLFVDESSSMRGAPIECAKAIGLALVYIATAQRRPVKLVSFASRHQTKELDIAPGENKSAELMDWLLSMLNGGTDPDAFVEQIPNRWNFPKGTTDFIVVTDGLMNVSASQTESFLAFKQEHKVRLQTVFIGPSYTNLGSLVPISDAIAAVPDLTLSQEAITDILSL